MGAPCEPSFRDVPLLAARGVTTHRQVAGATLDSSTGSMLFNHGQSLGSSTLDGSGDELDVELPPSPENVRMRQSILPESYLDPVHLTTAGETTINAEERAQEAQTRMDQLNLQALAVMARVESKLRGLEFAAVSTTPATPPKVSTSAPLAPIQPMSVQLQVQRLIEEATSHANLSQAYIGWCPFW
jgi:hypothetical protein